MGSPAWARCSASASRITLALRETPWVSRPVPGPASDSAGASSSAQAMAAAAVVLPMPISPPMKSCAPPCCARSAVWRPACRARASCSAVIAGSFAKFAVPGPRLRRSTPSSGPGSTTVPRFNTSSVAPSWRASTLMAAPPRAKFRTISVVTACGNADTPSATTPWSPANTPMCTRSSVGRGVPCMPARRMASDSSRPSAPGGLVSCVCRCSASRRAGSLIAAFGAHTQSVFMMRHFLSERAADPRP